MAKFSVIVAVHHDINVEAESDDEARELAVAEATEKYPDNCEVEVVTSDEVAEDTEDEEDD